ncbi:hypothetical protein [Duganella sp. LjRoot269]|jgi:hypothetical protein|uniref:hypothetical protein n=1 Tax=Duganella sp. LjRoot269 TaxID=3342305 RepID=UPI00159D1F7D
MTTSLTVSPAAQEQAATHRTGLLLVRCRCGTAPDEVPATALAIWHATRQAHFLAWLDAGGFGQPEPQTDAPIENSGIAPLFSAPLQDSLRGIEILSTPHS